MPPSRSRAKEQADLGGRRLFGDAIIIQAGRAVQILLNLGTFVILARGLGTEGFGVFSTIVAVIATGYAVADLGLGQLTVRAVAQNRQDEISAIRNAIPALYLSSTLVVIAACAVSWALTGAGKTAVEACALVGISYIHMQARVGVERGMWLGALQVVKSTSIEVMAATLRSVAVAVVWVGGGGTVMSYAWAIAVSGAVTLICVQRWLAYPVTTPTATKPETTAGRAILDALPFSFSSLTWNALVEVPKLLLSPLAGVVAVGYYAAGARLLAVANLPLQSVLNVVTPRVFAAARHPIQEGSRARAFLQSAGLVTGLGIGIAFLMALAAPVLPIIIGEDFTPAVPVLRVLAVSLPFQALAFAAGDWLGGLGRQHLRLWLTIAVLLMGLPLVFFSTRAHGAIGAATAFSALTVALAIATTVACWRLVRS
jgi:O-antigen/teichoic acid export membrane protein